jgi:hypothetical protein
VKMEFRQTLTNFMSERCPEQTRAPQQAAPLFDHFIGPGRVAPVPRRSSITVGYFVATILMPPILRA